MMSDANAAQIEYWNGQVGDRWAKFQARLDGAMADIASAVYAFAAAKSGERVLDIGCGCGTTTLELAKAVGPSGSVTAIDISHPMLEVARRRAEDAGTKIDFREADASEVKFEPEFDLLFSRFGVMFFADPVAGFANLRKALKPGGRLRFVCWRAGAENLWATAPFAAAQDLLPPPQVSDPHAPGPFAFADGARLKNILSQAGFTNPRLEKLETHMRMGADVDAAADQAFKIGPLARALAEADEAVRDQVRARVRDAMGQFKTPDGVNLPAACWLVSAEA
jgi:ubiquinone/menaquinone biosynthesis C-methylase UbiE